MDGRPEKDSVKKETCSHYKDSWGNILLVMQACFIVLATKSCDISGEVSKALQDVSSQLKGEHVLDVCKPYRARKSTVKASPNCSNHFNY